MTAFKTSLRCIGKPVTIISIGLLLINDHALKFAFPSVLTGKLSDFAGLFFFPFLLAAFLSLVTSPLHIPTRIILFASFSAAVFGFTLIKTWPLANSLIELWLGEALGARVQILLDPTDLVALAAILPAWRLWTRQRELPSNPSPGIIPYLALLCAAFATLATSCPSPARVTGLVVDGGNIYASLSDFEVALSMDSGRSWSRAFEIPGPISSRLAQEKTLPLMVCVKGDRQTCYRTSGDERVEGSQDGGKTWQVIWQISPNRRGFMEAYRLSAPGPCRTLFDPGPYDLVVLPNAAGTHTLIVALGSEGVLVRRLEGNWEQVGVLSAEPTPTRFSGDNLIRLFNITYPESLYLLGAALFTFWNLSLWGWSFLQSRDEILRVRLSILKRRIARTSLFILVATFLVSLIVPSALLILFLLAGLFILFAPLFIWALILRDQDNPEKAKSARTICFLTSVGLFPGSWSPFVMWAYGSIDSRDLALKVSVVLATLIVASGVLAMARLIRKQGSQVKILVSG